MRSLRVL